MTHIPETGIWFSVRRVLTTFPPCTPLGENMTVLNTADWLLGCSSPPPAPSSKDYGTEVHVCESKASGHTVLLEMQTEWVSIVKAGLRSDGFFWLQHCSDFLLLCSVPRSLDPIGCISVCGVCT